MTTGTSRNHRRRRALSLAETFAEVLQAARAGAAWAYERLYSELAPQVAGYLRMQRAARPAELTSAVLLEVFGELDGFQGGFAQFRVHVFTVAHRHLAGYRRVAGPAGGGEPGGGDAWVLRVSAVLSGDQRTVLALRIAAGLTAGEVAQVTGEPVATVRARQREALVALRHQLAQDRQAGDPCACE